MIEKKTCPNPAQIGGHKSFIVSSENLEPLSSESKSLSENREKEPMPCPIPRPFPHRLRLPQKRTSNAEIYKLFEQVKINILLLDAIK